MGGRKCCVPGCKSNYDNTNIFVSSFTFPRDEARRSHWLKCINRANFIPSLTAVVCVKHFSPELVIREDRAFRDDGTELVVARKIPKLANNAYPSIFPNQPSQIPHGPPARKKFLTERRTYSHKCCAKNCNEKKTKDSLYSFHSFPSDEKRREEWENALNLENFKATPNSRICSKHFEPESLYKTKFRGTRLKLDSLPTLFDFPLLSKTKERNHPSSEDEEKRKRKLFLGAFRKEDMDCPADARRVFKLANKDHTVKSATIKQLKMQKSRLAKKVTLLEGRLEAQNKLLVSDSAKSTLATNTGTESQNVIELPVVIKQEPIESSNESPPLVIDNVLSLEEWIPSTSSAPLSGSLPLFISSSFPENAYPADNPVLPNREETSVAIKHLSKSKINIVKLVTNDSTSSTAQAKLDQVHDKSSESSKKSKMFQNVTEPSIAVKQEPVKSSDEPLPLVIDNVPFVEELIPSTSSSSSFPENALTVSNLDTTNMDATSVVIKPEAISEVVKFTDESSPLVFKNIPHLEKLAPPSRSSSLSKSPPIFNNSFPIGKALIGANRDSTNVDETPVLNKPERKRAPVANKSERRRKQKIVKPDVRDSPPSAKQTKLHVPAKPPMSSKRSSKPHQSSGTKKSGRRSNPPTDDSQNVIREILLSLLNGTENSPLSGSRTSEKPGDLFDAFASFVAEKLRKMDWDSCAFALKAILDIVYNADQVQRTSEEDDGDISNFDISFNSSFDQA